MTYSGPRSRIVAEAEAYATRIEAAQALNDFNDRVRELAQTYQIDTWLLGASTKYKVEGSNDIHFVTRPIIAGHKNAIAEIGERLALGVDAFLKMPDPDEEDAETKFFDSTEDLTESDDTFIPGKGGKIH